MAGAHIAGGDHLAPHHRVLIRLHDLAGNALADDLLRTLVHQGIGGALDLVIRFHGHKVLVGQGAADADGQLVAGEIQLHHLVIAEADAAALQKDRQALPGGDGGDDLPGVVDGDGVPGLQNILHGLVAAQTAPQGQIVPVQLLGVLRHHLRAVLLHKDADGVQRGGGRRQGYAHEDGGRQGDHTGEAHQPVVPQRRGEAHQRRGMEKGVPAPGKAGAEKALIHLFLVGDHSVPCPCQPVTHGADAAAHKAHKTIRGVVDGLAHGNGVQLGAAAHRDRTPRHGFDSFHSTSQYSRPAPSVNRAAARIEIICNFCYRSEILVEYSTILPFCQVLPVFLAILPAFFVATPPFAWYYREKGGCFRGGIVESTGRDKRRDGGDRQRRQDQPAV